MLDGTKGHYLLEEVKAEISIGAVREVGDGCVATAMIGKPWTLQMGTTTYGQDRMVTKAMPMTIADLTRKAIRKAVRRPPPTIPSHIYPCQPRCQRCWTFCGSTNLRVRHGIMLAHAALAELAWRAATDGQWSCGAWSDDANAGVVRHANHGEEQANTNATGRLDGTGNDLDQPLTHTSKGQNHEDPSFDEDGCEGQTIRDRALATDTDDLVGEIGIQAHSRTGERKLIVQADWEKSGLTPRRQEDW